MYKIYAVLHSFYNKRTIFNFWRNGPKTLVNQEMSFIFCQTCLHVDRLLKKMMLCVHIFVIFVFSANLQFYAGSCHGSTRTTSTTPSTNNNNSTTTTTTTTNKNNNPSLLCPIILETAVCITQLNYIKKILVIQKSWSKRDKFQRSSCSSFLCP